MMRLINIDYLTFEEDDHQPMVPSCNIYSFDTWQFDLDMQKYGSEGKITPLRERLKRRLFLEVSTRVAESVPWDSERTNQCEDESNQNCEYSMFVGDQIQGRNDSSKN